MQVQVTGPTIHQDLLKTGCTPALDGPIGHPAYPLHCELLGRRPKK
jgi:hypothetical protein